MMKQIIVLIVISFIWSCKSESEFSSNQNQLRMDGIYVAVNQFASSKPDTLNGSLKTRKSLNILRFYNNSVGVIIPESVDEQFKFDSININRLFVWCQDFEKKNIKDKGFVNFKYQIINQDSIRFSQISKDVSIDYFGKFFLDSLCMNYQLKFNNNGLDNHLPARELGFKFYSIGNN